MFIFGIQNIWWEFYWICFQPSNIKIILLKIILLNLPCFKLTTCVSDLICLRVNFV